MRDLIEILKENLRLRWQEYCNRHQWDHVADVIETFGKWNTRKD
jgi:hypothetical protein